MPGYDGPDPKWGMPVAVIVFVLGISLMLIGSIVRACS